MPRLSCIIGALSALTLLSGCSDYVGYFQYAPHPALAEIQPAQPDQNPPASAFASVIGVRRADRDDDLPQSVEVRFRLENNGPHTLSFDPQSLELMTGDLVSFESPVLRPEHPATLAPQDIAMYTAFFPFPTRHSPDNTDMQSLQLRWAVKIDNRMARQVISFRRVHAQYDYYADPYWEGPYWGDPWYDHGGVLIVTRRR